MSNPTRREIIRAHEALNDISYLADTYLSSISGEFDETRNLRQTILDALPPIPQPTMDEIKWDDDKHYLAEAEDTDGGHFLMLGKWDSFSVQCVEPNTLQARIIGAGSLTPTGKRYALTEVQDND
ncbi:hypothetical protein ACKFRL_07760 [Corynebacterium marquesiae]|uniref:hypothetical protein n=1 Tax=Corynebacterium marquesiae TaxID=2913503 RepID=UPI0038D07019